MGLGLRALMTVCSRKLGSEDAEESVFVTSC